MRRNGPFVCARAQTDAAMKAAYLEAWTLSQRSGTRTGGARRPVLIAFVLRRYRHLRNRPGERGGRMTKWIAIWALCALITSTIIGCEDEISGVPKTTQPQEPQEPQEEPQEPQEPQPQPRGPLGVKLLLVLLVLLVLNRRLRLRLSMYPLVNLHIRLRTRIGALITEA